MKRAAILLSVITLAACGMPGKGTVEVSPKSALTGPKVVAIMGTRTEVVAALEEALGEHGFTFRHYQNRDRVAAPAGRLRPGESASATTS